MKGANIIIRTGAATYVRTYSYSWRQNTSSYAVIDVEMDV
jgi:hypothetical protein